MKKRIEICRHNHPFEWRDGREWRGEDAGCARRFMGEVWMAWVANAEFVGIFITKKFGSKRLEISFFWDLETHFLSGKNFFSYRTWVARRSCWRSGRYGRSRGCTCEQSNPTSTCPPALVGSFDVPAFFRRRGNTRGEGWESC